MRRKSSGFRDKKRMSIQGVDLPNSINQSPQINSQKYNGALKATSTQAESLKEIKEGVEESMFAGASSVLMDETVIESQNEMNKEPEFLKFDKDTIELPNKKAVDAILNKFKGNEHISKMKKWSSTGPYLYNGNKEINLGALYEEKKLRTLPFVNGDNLESIVPRASSELLDLLFNNLFEDLDAFYEWKKEEAQYHFLSKNPQERQTLIYHGKIWVHRGFLAERLSKTKWATVSYNESLRTGFSLFSAFRLMNIHFETSNIREMATISTIIIKDFSFEGFTKIDRLPPWMEFFLIRMIRKIGMEAVRDMINSKTKDPAILRIFQEFEKWSKKSEITDEILNKLGVVDASPPNQNKNEVPKK